MDEWSLGTSLASETFASEPLSSAGGAGDFRCLRLEAWCLGAVERRGSGAAAGRDSAAAESCLVGG